MIKWLREKLRKPVKYRVVFHSRGVMGNVVVLHRQVVTAKTEIEAHELAVKRDIDLYLKRTKGYRVLWYPYKLEDE